jgi:hypothetical protein
MTQLSSRLEYPFGALKRLISSGSRVAFLPPFHCPPPRIKAALRLYAAAVAGNTPVMGARALLQSRRTCPQ